MPMTTVMAERALALTILIMVVKIPSGLGKCRRYENGKNRTDAYGHVDAGLLCESDVWQ